MNKKATIFIIEDDPDAAEVMKVTLQAKDYKVLTASEPEKGFAKAKQAKPDLIILDVMFGKQETAKGFDYAVKMKQDKDLAAIPILMVTAVNIRHPGFKFSPETDMEYLPVDDFIDKPAQPRDLVEKVEKLLEQKVSRWRAWPQKSD
ncbi:MAG: response regulator [Spirochaetaceae bacterium]|nr:MAG: response regulator [Spirochaetaceae bacterium]